MAADNNQFELLYNFVFCVWDNVVGPKALKVWPAAEFRLKEKIVTDVDEIGVEVSEDSSLPTSFHPIWPAVGKDQISKYIAVHTLTGHLVKSKHADCELITDISLSVPALSFVSQTTTFYCLISHDEGQEGIAEEPNMSSLSIVFQLKYQNIFWNIHKLVTHLLRKISQRLKIGFLQDSCYHEKVIVNGWLSDAYEQILITAKRGVKFPISKPIAVKLTFQRSSLSWDVIITAMLTTSGSCCVVSKNEQYINAVVDLLIFFLPDANQSGCCRYASNSFSSGLLLQGLLENVHGNRTMNAADIILNHSPVTLVDLNRKGQVRFSGYIHEHYRRKQSQLRQQEYNIMHSLQPDTLFTTESVLRPFRGSSRYVRWCLEQLESHNVEHWPRIISSFQQALLVQAGNLMSAFVSECQQNKKCSSSEACQRLKKSLQITDPDFWLLTATAERLQPGFSNSLQVNNNTVF